MLRKCPHGGGEVADLPLETAQGGLNVAVVDFDGDHSYTLVRLAAGIVRVGLIPRNVTDVGEGTPPASTCFAGRSFACGHASMRPQRFAAEMADKAVYQAPAGLASMRPQRFAAEMRAALAEAAAKAEASMRPQRFAAEMPLP